MGFQSIKYCLKEGLKNVWANNIMSLASIIVMVCCMILTGSAILLSTNLTRALKSVEHQNSVKVFLTKKTNSVEIAQIEDQIKQGPNVIKCEYYSSDQASAQYKEVLGDLYEILQESGNPFPEAFHVSMEDFSLYDQTVKKLESIKNVESVSDRSETARRLSELNRLISTAGLWTVCALAIVSIFIISNTIKLTIHNRRLEISIMKSVGATNMFICTPFIVEGVVIGLLSAIVSSMILDIIYKSFIDVLGGIISFQGFYTRNIFWEVLKYFSIAGVFIGILGGLVSIRRYLKKEGVSIV